MSHSDSEMSERSYALPELSEEESFADPELSEEESFADPEESLVESRGDDVKEAESAAPVIQSTQQVSSRTCSVEWVGAVEKKPLSEDELKAFEKEMKNFYKEGKAVLLGKVFRVLSTDINY